MNHEAAYRILPAAGHRGAAIQAFVLAMMRDLYPPGSYHENPHDLACFEEVYIQPADAGFWIAEDADGRIVGTAAVRSYDRRFPEVEHAIGSGPVCEIVKCYIHPDCRRRGIGSRLYREAERFARAAGYKESYLHTSLYLPGGYPFWQSQAYIERHWESEQIVHMSKRWGGESGLCYRG
ncbi:GNAT family N-acetyltransferase [Paenibacillus hodogayensis]|uniref:GNAT family N-acetyltransferase n=1 Tax=Paenibacillus hodogayensis TaxID=279208 RepID=A0ABV5W373_9BACL